jgi:hypothetical protein
MNTKDYIEGILRDLDIRYYLLKVQIFLLGVFTYCAKSVYSLFFYKEQKKKQKYEDEELFI